MFKRKGYIFFIIILLIITMLSGCKNNEEKQSVSNRSDNSDKKEQSADKSQQIENTILPEIQIEKRKTFMIEGESKQEAEQSFMPIYSIEDLKKIESGDKGKYILMEDIDFAGNGISIKEFKGEFEGNYHQVKNMNVPLFSSLSGAIVRNLAIIDTTAEDAGLVHSIQEKTVIHNCYVTGAINKEQSLLAYKGGIVAGITGEGCEITNCFNCADIYGVGGGIVGIVEDRNYSTSSSCKIWGCENYGNIYCDDRGSSGGICGKMSMVEDSGSVMNRIENCFNYGTLEVKKGISSVATGDGVGGIIGCVVVDAPYGGDNIKASIFLCSNYGLIKKEDKAHVSVAGICGRAMCESRVERNADRTQVTSASIWFESCLNMNLSGSNVSGICAEIDCGINKLGEITLMKCINLSDSGNQIIPDYSDSDGVITVNNCYYLKNFKNYGTEKAIALIQEEMRSQETFKTFDFTTTWKIDAKINNGYPYIVNWYNGYPAYEREKDTKSAEETQEDTSLKLDESVWARVYKDFLLSFKQSSEYVQHKFTLAYIDDDDIPELVLIKGDSHADGADVYTYNKEKVYKINEYVYGGDGTFSYLEKNNLICSEWENKGHFVLKYFSIKDGKENLLAEFSDNVAAVGDDKAVYQYNGKNVSKDEYMTQKSQYIAKGNFVKQSYNDCLDITEQNLSVIY